LLADFSVLGRTAETALGSGRMEDSPMRWVLRVHVDVDLSELPRVTAPGHQDALDRVTAPMGVAAKVVGIQMPSTVDVQFSGPDEVSVGFDALVGAFRTAFGLSPGAARPLTVGTRPADPKFGGVRGAGKICGFCGGVDGKHDMSIPHS
jgi:hypothetical protein